jgi:FHS family L-fucose permease-like MFS transporter
MWGFLTSLNDILVPHLKSIFDLGYAQSQLVQAAFFSSYFVFGIPSGKVVEWIGYKKTMVAGLLTMSVGALLFIPAASIPSFPLFLTALIVLAAGITALQVSANPYVSVLGPAATASSRLNLTQAFNSLGTTIAPLLGGWLILSNAPKAMTEVRELSASALQAYRVHEASSVKLPYLGIALALVLLALTIAMTHLPAITATQDFRPGAGDALSTRQLLRHRNLMLGAVGIFVYVGAEVAIGSFLINYFNLPEIGNLIARDAAKYVAFYWGGAMIGRFIGSAVLQKFPTGKTLGAVALVASALVLTSALTFGHFAMWSIILVGFFNSIMFPSIFTLGIAGLGPLTGKGSGIMIAAIVGGAVIPYVQGKMVDHGVTTLHHAFILPFLCYLFIAYYGFEGSKQRVAA